MSDLAKYLRTKFGDDVVGLDVPTGKYFLSEDVTRIAGKLLTLPFYLNMKVSHEGTAEEAELLALNAASEEACELMESFGLIHVGG